MGKRIDYTGQKFGHWTVLERTNQKDTGRNYYWKAKCDCEVGTEKLSTIGNLKRSNSCDCLDLTGKIFGRLTVVEKIYVEGHKFWKCRCACGNEKNVVTGKLNDDSVRSCGCLRDDLNHRSGADHPGWKGGKSTDEDGYVRVYAPNHQNADSKGYVREHILIMTEHLKRPLKSDEYINHKNGVRDDNRLENLVLRKFFEPKEAKKLGAKQTVDYVGKKFGPWTVIARTDRKNKNGNYYWLAECDCEFKTQKEVTAECLRLTRRDKCNCATQKVDLTGKVFERLTAIKKIKMHNNKNGWLCKCSCDSNKEVYAGAYELLRGSMKSCGCLNDERRRKKGPEANGWKGGRHYTGKGYIRVYDPEHPNAGKNGYVMEHVKIMAEHICRPLKKEETVHHINGIKDDNRIENLELWDCSHPSGQRKEDKIKYYKDELLQNLSKEELQKWIQNL